MRRFAAYFITITIVFGTACTRFEPVPSNPGPQAPAVVPAVTPPEGPRQDFVPDGQLSLFGGYVFLKGKPNQYLVLDVQEVGAPGENYLAREPRVLDIEPTCISDGDQCKVALNSVGTEGIYASFAEQAFLDSAVPSRKASLGWHIVDRSLTATRIRWRLQSALSQLIVTLYVRQPSDFRKLSEPAWFQPLMVNDKRLRRDLFRPLIWSIKGLPSGVRAAVSEGITDWNRALQESTLQESFSADYLFLTVTDDEGPDLEVIWDDSKDAFVGIRTHIAYDPANGEVIGAGIVLGGPSLLTALHATYSLSNPDVSITQNEVNLMRGTRMGFQDFFASLGKAELFGEKRHTAEWQSACDLAPRGAVGHFTREDFDAAIIPKMDEDSYVASWLRQSVMHAVGHVLGLGHRYDASTRGAYSNQGSHRKRTVPPSVMDEFPLSMILFQLQHVDIAKEDKLSLEVLTGGPPADVPLCVASHLCVPGDFGTDPVTDYRGRYISHLRAITADSSLTDLNVVAHLDQLAMIVDDLMRAGFPATSSMQTWLIELLDESASRALVPSKDAAMVQVAVRLPWFGLLSSLQQGLISGAVKTRLAKDLVDAGQLPSSVRRAFFRSLVVYGVKSRRAFAEVAEVFEAAGIDLLAKNPISVMITLNDPKAADREDLPAVLSRTQEWMQAHLKNCGSFAGVKADREFCLDDWNQLEELLDLWEKAKRTVP